MTAPPDIPNVGFCGNQSFVRHDRPNFASVSSPSTETKPDQIIPKVISNLPLLVLIPGGIWRAIQIARMKKRTKVVDVRLAGIKKTDVQRRWFWAQFSLCVVTALLAQFQLLDAVIFREDIAPVLIVSDSIRSFAWAAVAVIIYFEYKKWLAHSAVVRWFYITSLITSVVKDSSLITEAIERGRSGLFFWTFQLVVLVQIALTVMGSLGFVRVIRKKLEPWLPPQFLIPVPQADGMNLGAMIWAAKPDGAMWIFAIIFAIVQGVATVRFVDEMTEANEAVVEDKPPEDIQEHMKLFVVFAVTSAVSCIGSGVLFGIAGMRYVRRLRTMLIDSLMVQEMAFFDGTSPGALIGHLTADTDKIADIKDFIPWFITPTCQVITAAVTLFAASWKLSLVTCALLMVEFIEAVTRSKQVTHKYSKMYIKTNRGASEKATEVLASFVTIRLFGQMRLESSVYGGKATAASKIGIRKEVLESFFQGLEVALHATVVGVGTLYAFNLIESHDMGKGELTKFLTIGFGMITSFQDVIKTTPLFAEVTGPASIIIGLIRRKPLMDQNVGSQIDDLQGHISFKNVSFTYPSAKEKTFANFDLEIPAGQSIAFVGPSGCGKSSLYKLFLRFYDPQEGNLKIDHVHELRDLKLKWWLDSIGVVSQEPVLFKGTLRYNILYGLPSTANVTEAEVMDAVRSAHLESLVDEKGLDFDVGDKGGSLSGGQKQRVCIARVFLRKPKILLLDEITSALDAISEAEVMKAVSGLMEGRTTFVIAHRLHTITGVDKICVLKKGSIVDTGTHAELVDKVGFYREMWNKQQGERSDTGTPASAEEPTASETRSWADVETLLDLLERQGASNEVLALSRRIRPPKTRLLGSSVGRTYDTESEAIEVGDIDVQNDEDEEENEPAIRPARYIPPINEAPRRRGKSLGAALGAANRRGPGSDSDEDEHSILLQDKV